MPAPRRPSKVLELSGAFRHNPQRRQRREGEPEPDRPLGDPPECLDEAERARWAEIAGVACWLTNADRAVVEHVCRLWMLVRSKRAVVGEQVLLARLMGELGLTPRGRAYVKVPGRPTEAANPFEALKDRGPAPESH